MPDRVVDDQSVISQLARTPNLSPRQFGELNDSVISIEDYKVALKTRGIIYTPEGNPEYENILATTYICALDTHRRGHGVCDDLATYFSSFFAGDPGYEIYMVEMHASTIRLGHAVAVFQDPSGQWGHSSNDIISARRYPSLMIAIQAAVLDSGFPGNSTVMWKKIEKGPWIYRAGQGVLLDPSQWVDRRKYQ